MWKWFVSLTIIIVALISGLLLHPISALASTTADVTITATGIVVGSPGGFTVFYISDYEVGLLWTKPVGAVNTMVRAKYGSYPDDPPHGHIPTDGYLVYYGGLSLASDTAVNLDETVTIIYYKAWSETASGVWSSFASSGTMEAPIMTLIGLFILCGIMSFVSAKSSYYILKVICGFCWCLLLAYWVKYPPSIVTAGSEVHTMGVVIFIGIAVAFFFFPMWAPKFQNGQELGGRFRLPFMSTEEQEEEERQRRHLPTRNERVSEYRERLDAAMRGDRRRR